MQPIYLIYFEDEAIERECNAYIISARDSNNLLLPIRVQPIIEVGCG